MSAAIVQTIRKKASTTPKRIALGDATDERVLTAARFITTERIADILLVGNPISIQREAQRAGITLNGIEFVSSATVPEIDRLAAAYYHRRKEKLDSIEAARAELCSNDILFGAALVADGFADGMVAGSQSTTGDVVRAALKGIGLADHVSSLSSMFLLAFPPIPGIRESEFCLAFADAAVLVEPNEEQLADIAIQTAHNYERLTGIEPYVAMLSFSTRGSAHSPSTEKMIAATQLVRKKDPSLPVDGEIQFDAAFVPGVAARKAANSSVAGRANVFIFPNLDAGNIAYKIAERLGMAEAIGPVLQGLRRPMNDLSRGASVSDIINMAAVTALQAESGTA